MEAKFSSKMNNNSLEKILISLNDGESVKEGEVFLAYMDTNTGNKFLVYTLENTQDEKARVEFKLAEITYNDGRYILEAENDYEHKNVVLPYITNIGTNNNKSLDEVEKLINEKFSNIIILDPNALTVNKKVEVSEKNPPRKANMPIMIANFIKKYYIHQLNKKLKEIYNIPFMDKEQIVQSKSDLDKIESKLVDLEEIYNNNIESKGESKSSERSLNEINVAKIDINDARNRLNKMEMPKNEAPIFQKPITNIGDVLKEEYPEVKEEKQEVNKVEDEVVLNNQDINNNKITELKRILDVKDAEIEKLKIKNNENLAIKEQLKIKDEKILSLTAQNAELSNKLIESDAIKKRIEEEFNNYQNEVVKEQEEIQTSLRSLNTIAIVEKEKAEQAKNEINSLRNENNDLKNQNAELLKENSTLINKNNKLEENSNENKRFLDQQNSIIEELRTEIQRLNDENTRLSFYEREYNRIASPVQQTLSGNGEEEFEQDLSREINSRKK